MDLHRLGHREREKSCKKNYKKMLLYYYFCGQRFENKNWWVKTAKTFLKKRVYTIPISKTKNKNKKNILQKRFVTVRPTFFVLQICVSVEFFKWKIIKHCQLCFILSDRK
jgi:hypothetical protein